MRGLPLIGLVALASSCANDPACLTASPAVPSVRWEHANQFSGGEPTCFDALVTRGDDAHILCEWECLGFWTNLHGTGRYYVSREWVRVSAGPSSPPQWVSAQFSEWPESANEQSWPCDGEGSP